MTLFLESSFMKVIVLWVSILNHCIWTSVEEVMTEIQNLLKAENRNSLKSHEAWRLGNGWRLVTATFSDDSARIDDSWRLWRSLTTRDSKSRWRLGNGLTTRQLSILASFDSQSFTLHFIKSKTPLMHQLKLKTCMKHTNNQYKYLGI